MKNGYAFIKAGSLDPAVLIVIFDDFAPAIRDEIKSVQAQTKKMLFEKLSKVMKCAHTEDHRNVLILRFNGGEQ